jgi:hypothetical protein
MSMSDQFDNAFKNYLGFLDNEYVSGALSLFLILYAGLAAPRLPGRVAALFDNTFFKLLIFFLIVYVSRRNPTVALIAAIAVMVSLLTLQRFKIGQEMMEVVGSQPAGVPGSAVPQPLSAEHGVLVDKVNQVKQALQAEGVTMTDDVVHEICKQVMAEHRNIVPPSKHGSSNHAGGQANNGGHASGQASSHDEAVSGYDHSHSNVGVLH